MRTGPWSRWMKRSGTALAALFSLALSLPLLADVTVTVVDDAGAAIPNGFRWQLEEDNTYGIKKTAPDGPWAGQAALGAPQLPGEQSPTAPWDPSAGAANPTHTTGVNIHKSHARTICVGDTQPANEESTNPVDPVAGPNTVTISASNCPGYDSAKNYVISVLPWHTSAVETPPPQQTGYGMTGRNIAAGQTSVTAVVHNFAHPTAQITAIVFEDIQAINGAYDQPAEHGLGEFTLVINDAAGQMKQDAFAYPIGTTYRYLCTMPDGRPAAANPDGVTCPATLVPLTQEQQPVFETDPDSGLPIVDFLGDGSIKTCPGPRGVSGTDGYTAYQRANCVDPYTLTPMGIGEAVVRYLAMNKYSIEPVPPAAGVNCGASNPSGAVTPNCSDMLLTATLEGTRHNDAWVRAGEPRYNIILGQQNWLVFYGFVHPMNTLSRLPGPRTGLITGRVVQAHELHPPLAPGLTPGLPVPTCYVGLSNLSGNDEQVYTAPCNADSTFRITGVPPGTYTLAIWDKAIKEIIGFRTIALGTTQGQSMTANLGAVAVYGWFGKLMGHVFDDPDADGLPAGGVPVSSASAAGVPNVPINLHFTDGSMIQNTLTNADGSFAFDQFFPWWRYVVAEVGVGPGKATGLTTIVDNGGALPNDKYGAIGINPQKQPPSASPFRTEAGTLLGTTRLQGPVTEAVNVYGDMTGYLAFGKTPFSFAKGENGGIKGFIDYATTRTEEDPRASATDGWEPGVPNVTVTLHKARRDTQNGSPVNNYWVIDDASDPRFPLTTRSDSWNDHLPENCVSDPIGVVNLWPNPEVVNGFTTRSCAETFHNWDQHRPGVFDGAYRFDVMRDATGTPLQDPTTHDPVPIPPGNYIVEVTPPVGYEVLKWGDRNIEFGDPKIPYLLQPPPCVGDPYDVPQFHTLFPDQEVPTDLSAVGLEWTPGVQQPLCNRKLVALNPGANAGADFNLFTMVPKSARIWGTVWNDLMLEFDPASPNAGGNLGVSYLPIAVKDFKGTEVARFYTDQWGHFDGLVPSNYDIAPPIPLGLVLSMLHIVPNDPGPILDTRSGSATFGQMITDPWFNPAYSQEVIQENWEFYPGRTTFVDTIVLPVAASSGSRVALNCAYTDQTPELRQVSDVIVSPGQTLTLTSVGTVQVPNPNFDPAATSGPTSEVLVTWDHGFGPQRPGSKVTVGGTPLTINAWAADGGSITATIPAGGAQGQLVVTRGDSGKSTTVGVTLRAPGAPVIVVSPPAPNCVGLDCGVIQPAIDAAPNGAIILIRPGRYQEQINLWKPVSLQGFGAAATINDGTAAIGNFPLKQKAFDQLIGFINDGTVDLAPGQLANFTLEGGSGILISACNPAGACPAGNNFSAAPPARIDGLTITGASEFAGGIVLNAYVNGLKISNNEINQNQGNISGGVRAGESLLESSFNPNLVVDHNRISQNGSRFSGGGGIALYSGSDNYQVTNNMICANFSAQYGGGIGHFGLSKNGLIQDNAIVSNESFDEGGGIHIGGEDPATTSGLTPGAGSVLINRNLIQGNKGGDDGGGIRTRRVNGQDVSSFRTTPANWYQIDIFNNMIVNNSSADHGGAASFDDTVKLNVIGNTIARNDSTSTGSGAFGGPCTENTPVGQQCPPQDQGGGLVSSIPQVGGIASFVHTAPLLSAMSQYCNSHFSERICSRFSNPQLLDDILWQNRSFFWNATLNNNLGGLVLSVTNARPGGYWDLAVYGTNGTMAPTYSVLTNGVGAAASSTNRVGTDPYPGPVTCTPAAGPGCTYFNVYQATSKGNALGGNFVVAIFTPNGVLGNYHIPSGSPAIKRGSAITQSLQNRDYDQDARVAPVDIGADEAPPPAPPQPQPGSLTVAPGSLNFGTVTRGVTSAPQVVTVTNTTASPVTITRTFTGDQQFNVAVGPTIWTTGTRTVPANGSLAINVRFVPSPSTTVGVKNATLTFTPSIVNPPLQVSLTGTAR